MTRRYGNVLKKTIQRGFKGKIYGFDIETCNNNKTFVCASIYLDDNNKWIFTDKDKLISFFKTKRFWNSIIAATNLAFDFFGTFYKKQDVNNFNLLFRGSDLVYAKTYIRHGKFNHKSYKTKNNKRKGRQGERLCFIDTFNYCRSSVERLGKIINAEKLTKPSFLGQMPKSEQEWKILIDYNMQDSKISKQYIQFLYNAFTDLGATPKLTIASTAMSLFKNKYLNQDCYYGHKPEELLEQFKAYYGGRTEVFSRGKLDNYFYYDFNSLYPSVMTLDFPDPNTKRITYKNTTKYIKEYHGISHVDVWCPKMKYPLLPYRTKEKLLFPTGSFSGWYSHVELKRAMQLGYVIKKVHKTYYFTQTCRPFNEYVHDLYNKRMEYKQDNNPMEGVVKLLLNSLYGKFGQKFTDRDNWQPFNQTLEELNELQEFERIGNFIRIKQKFTIPSNFCFPIWALHVTAYGRIKLHNAMIKCNPIYCDTDSVITKTKLPTSNELGDLKMEMEIESGMIVKPKFYALLDKNDNEYVKIKGVAKRLTFMEFNGMLINPKIAYKKFMKFKESIRRGFIPNEIVDMEKHLSLEDTKRNWETNFNPCELQTSLPINLKIEIVEQEVLNTPKSLQV